MDEHQNPPQEPNQPEQEGQPDTLGPHALNALMHDVEQYDTQFSIGAMMARMVMGHLREQQAADAAETEEGVKGPIEQLASESDDQAFTAAALEAVHSKTLAALGLSLEPVEGKTAIIMSQGVQAGTGELRVNIADGNRFLAFLGSLKAEKVHQTGADRSLATLADVLSQQVIDHYDLKEAPDAAIELLGRLERIGAEYQRLGVQSPGVERFTTYLAHSRAGDLREYVEITRQGLMQEPEVGFGPADWQRDITIESLQHRWEAAIDVLEYSRRNPRSGALYNSLYDQLVRCTRLARQFLAENPGYYDGNVNDHGTPMWQMDQILLNADERLRRSAPASE